MDNQTLNVRPKAGHGFIYCYTSPSNKRYIGQTRTTLKERAKKNAKGYKNCKAFYSAIQKYGWENFRAEILAEVPNDLLNDVELEFILRFHTTNSKYGYNITTNAYDFIASLNRVPVYSYDSKTGMFLQAYPSISEAARENNTWIRNLRRALNTHHCCRGKLWRTERYPIIEIIAAPRPNSKQIHMYNSITGDFMKTFSSIREASRETRYNRSTIQEHIRGNVIGKIPHTFRSFKVNNLYNGSSTTIPCGVDSSESKEK